jgi:hypothetical protein
MFQRTARPVKFNARKRGLKYGDESVLLRGFVGIQMGWDLRPFVGHPQMEIQFFRDHIGNAYMEVVGILKLFWQEQF